MKIEFDNSKPGYQQALLFRSLLEHARTNHLIDAANLDLVSDTQRQLAQFLSQGEFEEFRADESLTHGFDNICNPGLFNKLASLFRQLLGPGRKEQELSQQRRELLERAERAEAMAYESLAETADVGRQRDDAIKRIKDLEEEIVALKK